MMIGMMAFLFFTIIVAVLVELALEWSAKRILYRNITNPKETIRSGSSAERERMKDKYLHTLEQRLSDCNQKIDELQAENKRLKEELTERPYLCKPLEAATPQEGVSKLDGNKTNSDTQV